MSVRGPGRPRVLPEIRQTKDGKWETWVSVGTDPATGRRIQKHIKRKSREEVEKLRAEAVLERDQYKENVADIPKPGTTGAWFTEWLDLIVLDHRKRSTYANYESFVRRYIAPQLGRIRLRDLTDSHIREMLKKIPTRPSQEQCLKTVHAALNVAVDRHRVKENVAQFVSLPRTDPTWMDDDDDPEPMPLDGKVDPKRVISPNTINQVFTVSSQRRNHLRWVIGMLCGLRQSEVLGLCYSDIDWEAKTLTVRRNLVRRTYRHGCPATQPCKKSPGRCPNRIKNSQIDTTKTSASNRTIPLDDNMMEALKEHRRRHRAERLASTAKWPRMDWLFTDLDGRPIQHYTDQKAWKQILRDAGVSTNYRLHDMRHTAATMLGAAGTAPKTMQVIFGWSTPRMVNHYSHAIDAQVRDAMGQQLGRFDY